MYIEVLNLVDQEISELDDLKKYLYKVAKMRLSCEDDINDAVQETIIQTYKHIKSVRKIEYFKTWMIKILINNCNKVYKKSSKYKKTDYNDGTLVSPYSTQDEKIIENLDFYILIENLTYKERISLILFYLLEFTTKDISKILKEPESTIRNRISRARMKLKKIYERREENG